MIESEYRNIPLLSWPRDHRARLAPSTPSTEQNSIAAIVRSVDGPAAVEIAFIDCLIGSLPARFAESAKLASNRAAAALICVRGLADVRKSTFAWGSRRET
jgi:hypothetical protein